MKARFQARGGLERERNEVAVRRTGAVVAEQPFVNRIEAAHDVEAILRARIVRTRLDPGARAVRISARLARLARLARSGTVLCGILCM